MILISLFIILLSNGLIERKDVSILFSRLAMLTLVSSAFLIYNGFYITYIEKGISIYNGLFIITSIGQYFQLFIFVCSFLILALTGFYARESYTNKLKNVYVKKMINLIVNNNSEQYTIIEYALIIIFIIMGASLLICSGDFVSIFLSIELQSYGLYILSVIYRNSESATSSGLTYFLLGSLSSCFILLGIAFIYINTGIFNLDSFFVLSNLTNNFESLSI
jgi:NADH-ubiquinone oxidoreductase chain 2